ncbi:MAG: HAMP domain-containing sensor histidine kinase, partial [Opitutaceae bacterium]
TMQAAMQAKMEHLAMMSRGLAHDLKNLITPVSSFLVHTDSQFPVGTPEREVQVAATRSIRVMTEYVREALFFSEKMTPRFEPLQLGRIFQEVKALVAQRAAERDVKFLGSTEIGKEVWADAVLVQRMLVNMASNAIDASSAGQTVALSALPGRKGWLALRVSDQGEGIPPENLEHIFDPYFTTKKYGDDVRGFGLGLTICQKIVHLHCGKITVESRLGQGTTIMIELPNTQPA